MSLINDALKRAREAQQKAPAPAEPHFRPAESEAHARHNLGLLIPATLAVVALAGLLFVWRIYRTSDRSNVPQVAARTPAPIQPPVPAVAQTPAPAAVSQETAKPVIEQKRETPIPAAATVATNNLSPAPVALATNAAPAVPTIAPKAPPKLQGVVYNPKRPSALIDGKTLFIGDRVGVFRLTAITPTTVTLTGGGITNVLSLE